MRKMTKGMTGWITAICIVLCMVLSSCVSVVFAGPAYETAPGVDIQIRLIGFEDREYEVGAMVPAQLEAVLLVQDQQAGIASVFYSIEADGQGWNYQVPVCSMGEYETSPDPSAGYDNVQQGMLEEWNILAAEGDEIHCMSRTIYVYAQYSAVIRLAFTDRLGNLYSYQENYLVEEPQPAPEDAEGVPEEAEAEAPQQAPAEELQMQPEPEPEEVIPAPEEMPGEVPEEIQPEPEGMPEEPGLMTGQEAQPEEAEMQPEPEEVIPAPEEMPEEVTPEPEEGQAAPEEVTPEPEEPGLMAGQEAQPKESEAQPEPEPEEAIAAPEEMPEEVPEEGQAAPEEVTPEPEEPGLMAGQEVQPEEAEVQPEPEEVQPALEEMPGEIPEPEVKEQQPEAASEEAMAAVTDEASAPIAEQTVDEGLQPQAQTWSSYSGTPSYYYPQTAYSSGGTRGASSYSAAAGRGSYASSAGSASSAGGNTVAGDGKESSSTDKEKDAEPAAKADHGTGKEGDQATKKEEEQESEGSVYDLSAIEKYNGKYLKEVEDLVIYESNTRKVLPESVQVLVSRNEEMMELAKDTDYTFKLTGSSADQKIYKYTISKSVFQEDGAYRIYLFSEDEAGHYNASESMDAAIWFYIDNVSPLILSVETTKEQETKGVREIRIKDDTQLSDIEIYLGDQKVEFEEDGETYRFPVSEDNEHADVKVVAKDRAGNSYERVLTNYVQAGKAKVRAGMSPLPIFILAAAGVLAGVMVYRKRKNLRRARRTR